MVVQRFDDIHWLTDFFGRLLFVYWFCICFFDVDVESWWNCTDFVMIIFSILSLRIEWWNWGENKDFWCDYFPKNCCCGQQMKNRERFGMSLHSSWTEGRILFQMYVLFRGVLFLSGRLFCSRHVDHNLRSFSSSILNGKFIHFDAKTIQSGYV